MQRGRRRARLATELEARVRRACDQTPAALSLLLFDLDGFMAATGSREVVTEAGKRETARLAAALERELHSADLVRFSRDGYAVLLETTAAEAVIRAEHVRQAVEQRSADVDCTVSIGVASRGPGRDADPAAMVWAAMAALDRAKRDGGNRIRVAEDERMTMKSTYYPRIQLERLARLAELEERPESELLREALEFLLASYEV